MPKPIIGQHHPDQDPREIAQRLAKRDEDRKRAAEALRLEVEKRQAALKESDIGQVMEKINSLEYMLSVITTNQEHMALEIRDIMKHFGIDLHGVEDDNIDHN